MEYYSERELKGIINLFSSGDITTDCPEDVVKIMTEIMKLTDKAEIDEAVKKIKYSYNE